MRQGWNVQTLSWTCSKLQTGISWSQTYICWRPSKIFIETIPGSLQQSKMEKYVCVALKAGYIKKWKMVSQSLSRFALFTRNGYERGTSSCPLTRGINTVILRSSNHASVINWWAHIAYRDYCILFEINCLTLLCISKYSFNEGTNCGLACLTNLTALNISTFFVDAT